MSLTGNLFSKLGLGEGARPTFLSQYTSPPSRPVDEHDLAELSPRPEDALLADDPSSHTTGRSRAGEMRSGPDSARARNKRDSDSTRATVSVASQSQSQSQSPPWSAYNDGDSARDSSDSRPSERPHRRREPGASKVPRIWRPSFLAEAAGPSAGVTQPSFFESMFVGRATHLERSSSIKADHRFKLMQRRERQLQQELQQLLDAQDYALEKHLANTTPEDDVALRSSSPVSETPKGHVVPVRQPKKRPMSKREARLGIARCMSLLSDLKNEEEACIAHALADRKAALSRLRHLSTKRNSIVAEMKAIESDGDQPLRREISRMERQHRNVSEEISNLEERLRHLKLTRTKLESRIAEAKSARDSELSGYKGALSECDQRIDDIMHYPEVSVLEIEALVSQDADLGALVGQHISGFEFLSLRPERRTLPMAKDWWEGEVQVLELRKGTVDKERAALDEGTQLWQKLLLRLEAHDRQLKSTFHALSEYSSTQPRTSKAHDLGEILTKQYAMCKETMHHLEQLYDYTGAQGWNLLVTALGAEINYFRGLKTQLGNTLHVVGWADGVVTPRPNTPAQANVRDNDILGADYSNADMRKTDDLDQSSTGSILHHRAGNAESRHSASHLNTDMDDPPGEPKHGEDSKNDNEVPPGLFNEAHRDSEDEHNDIPPEFLSMHSPSSRQRGKGKGKMSVIAGPAPYTVDERKDHEGADGEEDKVPLSRESSANEVPPDLLAESHKSLD
ncbi:hypothetical protein F4777DRAFT_368259 [Nemania sp. FL0916]|nr:hypothetical protein F4777DRAFT_368259 [Nemania sp. FL0916]